MKTSQLGPFAGLNNRLPEFALGATKEHGAYLSVAENVDLDNSGHLRLRRAGSLVQAVSGAHSLHEDLVVRDSVLYRVTLPSYSEVMLKLLSSNARMSYVDFDGATYYSNGVDSGRIDANTVYPIGLPTPEAPSVSALPGGDLYQGRYQVAVSYVNADTGEEGGVSASSNPLISSTTGGLRVSLPSTTLGATHINVYVSTVNGAVPLLNTSVTVGTTVVDVVLPSTGREANQRYEAPLPAGTLFFFNGCLCSFDGSDIYEGIPFRPGYYLPSEGRIPFPADISNVIPAQNGVYVVADKTYWLQGPRMTTVEMIQDVLPYGGVPGTAFSVPQKSQYGWFGDKGFVIGSPQGEVQAVMTETVDVVAPAHGVSAVFEDRGYRRVVSCGYCMNLETLGVTTYADYDYSSISGNYGTKADGLYDLTTTGDLAYILGLGKQDFGVENLKHMPAVYLGCVSSEPLRVTINGYEYAARNCSDTMKVHRVDPGKGLRANWFDLSISGETDFTLASVSFGPVASQRRI